jgi:hypothetical protein
MALFLLGTFYVATVVAGYVVEVVFDVLGLVPGQANAKIPTEGVTWNYTTGLDIAFLVLAAALLIRFFRTGGMDMLRMMGGSPDGTGHDHGAEHRADRGHGHDAHRTGHGPSTAPGHDRPRH